MTTWIRAATDSLCGLCSAQIAPGDLVLVMTLPGVKTPKTRCHACAGEPVPELPQRIETTPLARVESMRRLDAASIKPETVS